MGKLWKAVNRNDPCAKCGKTSWCSFRLDGRFYTCRRVDDGTGKRKKDKNNEDFYLYHRQITEAGQYYESSSEVSLRTNEVPCGSPEQLDKVYRSFIKLVPLSKEHGENLQKRGLNEVEITQRLYRTLPIYGRSRIAAELIDQFGENLCKKIPGLYIKDKRYWSLAGSAGMLVPVQQFGKLISFKIRADSSQDENSRYTSLSSKRHGGPSPGANVHIPTFNGEKTEIFRLTEGELKADIATVLSGLHTISIPGVSAWRRAIPILKTLGAKTVKLAFDSDVATKSQVKKNFIDTAKALIGEGFKLEVETWD
jgi:hypothetical protein